LIAAAPKVVIGPARMESVLKLSPYIREAVVTGGRARRSASDRLRRRWSVMAITFLKLKTW